MMQRLLAALILAGTAIAAVPGEADAQFFGRNKVQYRAFDFKVIKTEHFDLHFYEEEREAAYDAARMAERAYARLSAILQHEFEEKKPIILYASHSHFQQTNATHGLIAEGTGAFAEVLKSRVVIPLTGTYGEFDHVLRHELVHSFQHDIIFRNAALDNANPFATRYPLWFIEGMAEYLSIGHIDAITAAWLRDAAMAGYLRTIGEMNRRDDYLSYRFGQALWAYIGSKWGDEVIGILLQRATRMGVERAFEVTIGMTLEQLSQEWMAMVRRTYLPQVADYQRPVAFAEPVLRHEKLEDPSYLAPAISPDGETMALFSARDGFFPDLWLADARTGEFERRLVGSSRESDFESLRYMSSSAAFSPDGRRLAFAAQTGGRDALYIYDLEENEVEKKLEFELGAIMAPSWSPDSRRIAFAGLDGGLSDLYVTDLDGNLQRLTDDRYADLFPSWSPDGRTIAFSTDRGEGTDFDTLRYEELRVALLDVESGGIEVLPHQVGRNINPVWSPDSRALVWVGDRTGTKNLYLYERDERALSRITNLLSGVMGPTATDLSPTLSWARESGRLLFVYFESAGQSIYALDDPRELPRVAVSELPRHPDGVPILATGPGREGGRAPAAEEKEPAPIETDAVASASFYREGEAFRPSASLPEGVEVPEPVTVLSLLDSATYALPDTAAFEVVDYDVKFTPDMIGRPTIGAQVGGYYGNGVYGGSFISLSDMLGNHNIMLAGSINGSFSDAMFYGGYNFLKTRANYGAAVTQIPLYRYLTGGIFQVPNGDGGNDWVAGDVFLRDVIRSAQGQISYPFSTYQRLELGGSATFLKEDLIIRGVNMSRGEPIDRSDRVADFTFFEPTAALVFDNALFGWTGPILGRRYRIQLSRTVGDFQYSEGLVDFRNYLNYNRKIVLATQFINLTKVGRDADRFPLYWGGPYFLRGYGASSFDPATDECAVGRDPEGQTACPVRDQLIGSSAAILKTELRFPIITQLQIGFLGNFPPVDAIVFFDGGLAWDNRICRRTDLSRVGSCGGSGDDVSLVWQREEGQDPLHFRQPLFSYGVGLRINVFYTILRLDYAIPMSRPDRSGRFSFSIGPSF